MVFAMKVEEFKPGLMARLSAVICAIMLVGAAAPHTSEAATLQEIKARGYLVAATEDNFPPFEFIKDGKPTGMDHDLFALLKQQAPFEIRQQIIPWQGLLTGVATQQYDLALSAGTISAQRAEQFDFLMPIAEATHYYVKRKGDNSIAAIKDLGDRPFGLQQSSSIHQRLPEVAELVRKSGGGKLHEPKLYASYSDAFQDLALGRIDFVLNSIVSSMDLVRARPNDFEIGEAVVAQGYHAWAVKRGNDELRDYLNAFFKQIRESGKLYELQEKWIGRTFKDLPWEARLPGNQPIPR
jgi:polar amino acid transport system substrate-binding protein